MKNRNILYARQETKIYGNSYKPSLNVVRFAKSIFSVFLYGSSTATSYMVGRKRVNK
ncbi:MAG TPA: hypothetical protein VM368_04810 [Flavisolibacter sp.]|nr:hypothetical protein [Flavisolibacter sp.]